MKKKEAFTDQKRREYQHKYYREHKEKALAYQRAYKKKWQKSTKLLKKTAPDRVRWQGIKKQVFSASDLTKAPTARFQRQLELILSGQMGFVL